MGVYLATPCKVKDLDSGGNNILTYGVGDMQGCKSILKTWMRFLNSHFLYLMILGRKGMEDAHITLLNINKDSDADENSQEISVFGVFDGHGGKEVAKFTARHFQEVLENTSEYQSGDFATSLTKTFHTIDEKLFDISVSRWEYSFLLVFVYFSIFAINL